MTGRALAGKADPSRITAETFVRRRKTGPKKVRPLPGLLVMQRLVRDPGGQFRMPVTCRLIVWLPSRVTSFRRSDRFQSCP